MTYSDDDLAALGGGGGGGSSFNWGGLLGGVLNNASQIGGAYLANQNQPKPAKAPKVKIVQAKTNFTPWVIGGAVAVVLLIAVVALRK